MDFLKSSLSAFYSGFRIRDFSNYSSLKRVVFTNGAYLNNAIRLWKKRFIFGIHLGFVLLTLWSGAQIRVSLQTKHMGCDHST